MSVNTSHANNGVLIYSGETILLFSDNVTMEFGGNDVPLFKGTKAGRIYLTTHRIIFNSKNMAKDELKSFSAPFVAMNSVKLEQPTFGANYIKGHIAAQENGGYVGEVSFKLKFNSGGAIDFGQALLRAAQMTKSHVGNIAPPPYETPDGAWFQAPPPAYTPTPQGYGWLPNNNNFSNPDPNSVFMTDNPPPYPGINSGIPTQQPAQGGTGYPNAAPAYPGYPPQQATGYPGYPQAPAYPGHQAAGYPGYPDGQQQPGYPGQQPGFGYPAPPQTAGGVYPNLYQNGYPGAPGYPPAPYPNGGAMGFNPPPYTQHEEKRPL